MIYQFSVDKTPTQQDKSQIEKRHLYNQQYPILKIMNAALLVDWLSNSNGYLAS